MGVSRAESVFYGFVVALSSTAIVLRALTERRELDAPHGRFIVGTLMATEHIRIAASSARRSMSRLTR